MYPLRFEPPPPPLPPRRKDKSENNEVDYPQAIGSEHASLDIPFSIFLILGKHINVLYTQKIKLGKEGWEEIEILTQTRANAPRHACYCLSVPNPPFDTLLCDAGAKTLQTAFPLCLSARLRQPEVRGGPRAWRRRKGLFLPVCLDACNSCESPSSSPLHPAAPVPSWSSSESQLTVFPALRKPDPLRRFQVTCTNQRVPPSQSAGFHL